MSNYSLCVIAAIFYAMLGLAGVTFFGAMFFYYWEPFK